jgi:uncharacterized iron-regulated protein
MTAPTANDIKERLLELTQKFLRIYGAADTLLEARDHIASLEEAIRTTDEAHERKLAAVASFTASLEAKTETMEEKARTVISQFGGVAAARYDDALAGVTAALVSSC